MTREDPSLVLSAPRRFSRRRAARLFAVLLSLLAVVAFAFARGALADPPAPATPQAPLTGPTIRVVDDPATGKVRLELAARAFARPDGSGPTVLLVSAVHVADESFYKAIQAYLDQQDVVLYEGVKPAGAGRIDDEHLDDAGRAAATKRRLDFLALVIDKYAAKHAELPASFEDLTAHADKRLAKILASLQTDAWGHPIAYTLTSAAPATVTLTSPGADNAPGGQGPAADIAVTITAKPGAPAAPTSDHSLQRQLADSMRLTFQLDAIDSSKPAWRSSDLSIDQVERRIAEAGGDASIILNLLDDSSFMSKLAGGLFRFIGATKQGSSMLKLMMVEVLGQSDTLIGPAPATGPLAKLAPVMNVIVKDRNAVVLGDIKHIIDTEPAVKTIAAFYGGGHMADLQGRLTAELGLVPKSERWFTAIEVDPKDAGMSAADLAATRAMIKQMLGSN